MKVSKEKFWRKDNPICYASGVSLLIILGYLIIGFRSDCMGNSCETNFKIFWESDPNEIGDTLAGLFSALAFVWIITTVMMQSKELAAQREELSLTRKEFARMAKAQEAQQYSLEAQAEIFRDEQKQRDEERARKLLDQKVGSLVNLIRESKGLAWHRIRRQYETGHVVIAQSPDRTLFDRVSIVDLPNSDEFIRHQFMHVEKMKSYLVDGVGHFEECPSADLIIPFLGALNAILVLQDRLSDDQVERLGTIGLFGLRALLKEISELEIWTDMVAPQ